METVHWFHSNIAPWFGDITAVYLIIGFFVFVYRVIYQIADEIQSMRRCRRRYPDIKVESSLKLSDLISDELLIIFLWLPEALLEVMF